MIGGPLEQLRRLLAPAAGIVQGTVVKNEAGLITVATAGGTVTAKRSPGDASAYPPGTVVTVRDGVVMGSKISGAVYVV